MQNCSSANFQHVCEIDFYGENAVIVNEVQTAGEKGEQGEKGQQGEKGNLMLMKIYNLTHKNKSLRKCILNRDQRFRRTERISRPIGKSRRERRSR